MFQFLLRKERGLSPFGNNYPNRNPAIVHSRTNRREVDGIPTHTASDSADLGSCVHADQPPLTCPFLVRPDVIEVDSEMDERKRSRNRGLLLLLVPCEFIFQSRILFNRTAPHFLRVP